MEFYFKVRIASCNGLIVWLCFFFFLLAFNFQCLHFGFLFNSTTFTKMSTLTNVVASKTITINTLLVTKLEEAMDNVYIYQAKEGDLSLFCNLVSIYFFVILICWKFCKTTKQQQNVWQFKICDTCCARGAHLSREGCGFKFVSKQTSFVVLLFFFNVQEPLILNFGFSTPIPFFLIGLWNVTIVVEFFEKLLWHGSCFFFLIAC